MIEDKDKNKDQSEMPYQYYGEELEYFLSTHNWRSYVYKHLKSHLSGEVAEVGPGMGYFTTLLAKESQIKSLDLYEPDKHHCEFMKDLGFIDRDRVNLFEDKFKVSVKKYDRIFLMDVLEHIEDDTEMLRMLNLSLKDNGRIILLVPAHMFLFSEFDKSIGHFRRYNREMFQRNCPAELRIETSIYLDSIGIAASFFAKVFKLQPSKNTLSFWDKVLVNISKVVDLIFFKHMGKSLLIVLSKDGVSFRSPSG